MVETLDQTAPPRSRGRGRMLGAATTLVIAAILLFALVLLRPFAPTAESAVLSAEDRQALEGSLRMLSPRISGRTKDGEPYVIEAASALPDGPNPNLITLRDLDASVVLSDGRDAALTAKQGRFQREDEVIELTGGVQAETSDGYVIETDSVEVELDQKRINAPDGVRAHGPRGSLEADTLEAVDDVERIAIFRGNVRVIFNPQADLPAEQE